VREYEMAASLGMSVAPNPSIGDANIRFVLPMHSPVQVSLVNSIGEKVNTVYAGDLDAGEHSFPISFAASGVYYVRVQTAKGTGVLQVAVTR